MERIRKPIKPDPPIVINNNNTTQRAGGISLGLGGILTIIFVIAQLAGVISWSWWWVFSPLWLPLAVILGLLIGIPVIGLLIWGIVAFLTWIIGAPFRWWKRRKRNRK